VLLLAVVSAYQIRIQWLSYRWSILCGIIRRTVMISPSNRLCSYDVLQCILLLVALQHESRLSDYFNFWWRYVDFSYRVVLLCRFLLLHTALISDSTIGRFRVTSLARVKNGSVHGRAFVKPKLWFALTLML